MSKSKKPAETPTPISKETVTFSVRLTEEQRDLLTKAAELRGWTPTNLLRIAALEKAAYIINTSTLTKLDFRTLATRAAAQLFAARDYYQLSSDGKRLEEEHGSLYEVEPAPLNDDELHQVRRAVKYGGAEFMKLVLDAGNAMTSPHKRDLPEPIDPSGAV